MNPSPRKAVWRSLAFGAAGAIAGAAITLCIQHSHAQPKTAVAALASGADMPAESIEMGGSRIPAPTMAVAAPLSQRDTFTPSQSFAGPQSGQNGVSMAGIAPGRAVERSETVSGYRFEVGRRAVDYYDPQTNTTVATGTVDPGATAGWADDDYRVPAERIGRNGLLSNPAVDPPSSHGAAYSRTY